MLLLNSLLLNDIVSVQALAPEFLYSKNSGAALASVLFVFTWEVYWEWLGAGGS